MKYITVVTEGRNKIINLSAVDNDNKKINNIVYKLDLGNNIELRNLANYLPNLFEKNKEFSKLYNDSHKIIQQDNKNYILEELEEYLMTQHSELVSEFLVKMYNFTVMGGNYISLRNDNNVTIENYVKIITECSLLNRRLNEELEVIYIKVNTVNGEDSIEPLGNVNNIFLLNDFKIIERNSFGENCWETIYTTKSDNIKWE